MKHKSKVRVVIVYGFYLILLFAIQSAWPQTSGDGIKPNLLLVFAILSGYQFGFADGLTIGLLAGFLLDFSSGRGIGPGMLLFMIAAISASRLFRKKLVRSVLPAFLSTIICSLFYEASVRVILWLSIVVQDMPLGLIVWTAVLYDVLAAVLLNVLVMVPLFILLRYFGPYKRSLGPGHIEREGSRVGW